MHFTVLVTFTLALSVPVAQARQKYAVHLWESDNKCSGDKKTVVGVEGENEGPTGHSECLDINTRKYHTVSAYNEDTCCDFFTEYKCKGDKKSNQSAKPGACFGGFSPLGCVKDTKIKSFRCKFGG